MHMPQSQLSWDVLFRSFRDLLPNKLLRGRKAGDRSKRGRRRGKRSIRGWRRRNGRSRHRGPTASVRRCALRSWTRTRCLPISAMPRGAAWRRNCRCQRSPPPNSPGGSLSAIAQARISWAISSRALMALSRRADAGTTGFGIGATQRTNSTRCSRYRRTSPSLFPRSWARAARSRRRDAPGCTDIVAALVSRRRGSGTAAFRTRHL